MVLADLLGGILRAALYKATERLWENAVDAAWEPMAGPLKERFLKMAGNDRESQRRAAFAKAFAVARILTLREATDPAEAQKIFDTLDGKLDKRVAEYFSEEAVKLLLFSTVPDASDLTDVCQRTLHFEALFPERSPPSAELVGTVLSSFLTNLREALLDQEPYRDLVQREMLRTLRQIVAELRFGFQSL